MSFDAWITVATIVAAVIAMALGRAPEVVMMVALAVLMLFGVLTPAEAAAGFGSVTVLTVAALFVIGEGIRRTGVLAYAADTILGRRPKREPLVRLLLPASFLSAFLNNTLVVAVFTPAVIDWCKRRGKSRSKMLMPLAFATSLGGVSTLIGTSTNLVVDGLMRDMGMEGLGMFELAWVGIPVTVVGILTLTTLAPRLLPHREDPVTTTNREQREFLVELLVEPASRLANQTIAEAGLRNLPGLYLINIERHGRFLGPVAPTQSVEGGDRLVFAGIASSVRELRHIPGLTPAPEHHYDPLSVARGSHLFEAVVSSSSPLVGSTIKDVGFRRRYDAAVIALHRAGKRLASKLGEVEVRAGDTLMIEAGADFAQRWRETAEFALVSAVDAQPPPRPHRAPHACALLALAVAASALDLVPLLPALFVAVAGMLQLGLLSPADARESVRFSVLVVIAGALGLAQALVASGAAEALGAQAVVAGATIGPHGLLIVTMTVTVILSAFLTNPAAAAIMLPLSIGIAESAALPLRPFAIAVAVGSSMSFLTPFSYQTNLMVYGPGGYRLSDFPRLGVPLTVLALASAAIAIAVVWPPASVP